MTDRGFARTTYVSTQGVHHNEINITFAAPPVSGVEPSLLKRDGTDATATTAIAPYFDEYVKFFDDTTNFGLVEFYKVIPTTLERVFIWGYNVNMEGAAATANVPLGMLTMTWKSTKGGTIRVVMMEGVAAVNQKLAPPYIAATPFADLSDYMVSGDCILVGRDDAFAFAAISAKSKTSDVLRG